MASLTSASMERTYLPGEPAGYSGYQTYLLRRLADLQRRHSDLPDTYRNHPIGRLTAAALESTLAECGWAGIAREAGWILHKTRGSASA